MNEGLGTRRPQDLEQRLIDQSRFISAPHRAIVARMSEADRRRCVYVVDGDLGHYRLIVSLYGTGGMTAKIATDTIKIEGGEVHDCDAAEPLLWHDTLEPVVLMSGFERNRIDQGLEAPEIMAAFLEATHLETHASPIGGYATWRATLEMYAQSIADREQLNVQIRARMPMPIGSPERRRSTSYTIEAYHPDEKRAYIPLDPCLERLRELDEQMQPSAAVLRICAPLMLRQEHIETISCAPRTW